MPGGALIDEGIYWIDLFRWMAGSEVVRVEATLANLVHKDIEVEDWGMATFTFAERHGRDARSVVDDQLRRRKTGPSPKQNSVVRLELVGTRGEIIDQWFRSPGRAVLARAPPTGCSSGSPSSLLRRPSPFPLTHLIECLEQKRPPASTIQDARSVVRSWRWRRMQSARGKRPVRLSLVA